MKTTKYQDGGRTMREKAAVRKDEKGKGMYVPVDGYRKTKGLYVGYNKAGRKEVKETGGTEVYNLKPTRRVMQDGGYVKTPGKTGARASISKTTKTMSGGTKTKTISGGPLVPNAKGSVTKTKTNADGSLNKTSTKSISGNRASNKISKYQDGGKVTRGDIRDAQREAKLKRIQAGTEPSTYQKVSDIAGKVADTAVSASQTAKAISDTRRPSGAGGPGGMKKGGMVKKTMTSKKK